LRVNLGDGIAEDDYERNVDTPLTILQHLPTSCLPMNIDPSSNRKPSIVICEQQAILFDIIIFEFLFSAAHRAKFRNREQERESGAI